MRTRVFAYTKFVYGALLIGLALDLATHAIPTPQSAGLVGGSSPSTSANRTALCPAGWSLAVTTKQEAGQLCVRVDQTERSWDAAQQTCRKSKGFLIKLDSILKIDNTELAEYLRRRGLDEVWTGMHHDHGTLVWDDLRPQMVRSYGGELQSVGWRRRGWKLDSSSFKKGSKTCGILQVGDHSEDVSNSQERSGVRGKRSPLQVPGNGRLRLPGFPGGDGGGNRFSVPPRKDNEDRKPALQEAKLEELQKFLKNTGFKESYVENIGEGTQKPGTDKALSGGTTISTTTTDQSNLEDDDYHGITKRSPSTSTTLTPGTITKATGGQTDAPKFAPQKSVKGTSLPTYTDAQTTISPESATRIDNILHQLLQDSIVDGSQTKTTAAADSGNLTGAPEIAFANESPVFMQQESLGLPLPLDLQKSSESQSNGLDSNEYLKFLLQQSTITVTPTSNSGSSSTTNAQTELPTTAPKEIQAIDSKGAEKTSTSVPKNQIDSIDSVAEKFDPLGVVNENLFPATSTSRSFTKETTAAAKTATTADRPHDDSFNSVLSMEDSQGKTSKVSSELPPDTSTQKSVTKILSTIIDNLLSPKATTTTNEPYKTSTSWNSTTTTPDIDDSAESTDSVASAEVTSPSPLDNNTQVNTNHSTSTNNADSNQDSGEIDLLGSLGTNYTDQLLDSILQDSKSSSNDSAEVEAGKTQTNVHPGDVSQLFNAKPTNDSRSSEEDTKPAKLKDQGSGDSSNAAKEVINDKTDSIGLSIEENRDSLLQDSQDSSRETSEATSSEELHQSSKERDLDPNAPSDTISLDSCDEDHASVCVTEAIEAMSLVGHCSRGYYGHRLLDKCYKPLGFTLTELEARQRCLSDSASLVTANNDLYGNVTAMLVDYFVQDRKFGKRIWVDTTLNQDVPVLASGQCSALDDGQLLQVSCAERLPFLCQQDAYILSAHPEDIQDEDSVTYVRNMTSWHPQTIWCPLHMSASDDVILWFKDGRPIVYEDDDDRTSFGSRNGQVPVRLDLELSILERVGEGGARIRKPAMLQGEYWCEIWRRDPFHRVVSHRIFLRFSDVITLHGQITTEPTDHVTAAMFNRMGYMSGLPAVMERRLATMNKRIAQLLQSIMPIVKDVITFIKSTSPVTGRSEFVTYICTATGDLSPHLRGSLADLYLSTLEEALVQNEDDIRKEWNLTLPFHQAVSVTMPDMCPEASLFDKTTNLSATFRSTPVNNIALSSDVCDGAHTGTAHCKGDLQTGAYWENWRVTERCGHKDSSSSEEDVPRSSDFDRDDSKADDKFDLGDGFKPPNSALLELDEVDIDSDNVGDVAERLADVVDKSDELSEIDIESVARMLDRIVSVKKPPSSISDKLIKTVNKVLDAPEQELRKAERKNKAPSRLIHDLEVFGEKVDMGVDPRVRHVTPNVAMELWNLEDANEVVIGFGATQTPSWSAPLSDPRIITIKDRSWAEKHIQDFDIAIELPESLVKNTVRYSDSSLRLSMFIYRKPGLFLPPEGESSEEEIDGRINSAIISASLGGRKVRGLEEKVKLIFKPFKEVEDHRDLVTHCAFWDTEAAGRAKWSDAGCVYNGTINGRDVCLCDHLTNFAVLLDFYGDERPISAAHETSLSILSLIGISLSIIGLAITIITFLAFKKLRQGRAQQTLFNMAIALLCFQTTFLVGVKQTSIVPLCLTVAVLLHYFILVSFAWMLIEAVLQYLTFVKVLGTYISNYTLKTVIPAWGFPLLPVIAVLATDYHLYLGRSNYCWMDLQAFYYAFALPVGIIILFNFVMFFVILISLITRPKGLRSNQTNNKTRETNLKAAFTIFILLGLTWLFGYLAIEDARLPFQYAFTILSSMQGFLIFVLMVARRRQVRDQWELMCCRKRKGKQHKQKKLSPMSSHSTSSSSNSMSNSRTLPSFINHGYSGDSMVLKSSVLQRQTSVSV